MVSGLFGTLLSEISQALKLDPPLKPDDKDTCLVRFKNGLNIQMEINEGKECFVIGLPLQRIPEGKFRQEVFRAALKENGAPHEIAATFSYSRKLDQLFMFKEIPLEDLQGAFIVEKLELFINKALHWKEALEKSLVPEVKELSKNTNIFEMRR